MDQNLRRSQTSDGAATAGVSDSFSRCPQPQGQEAKQKEIKPKDQTPTCADQCGSGGSVSPFGQLKNEH